jgi:hypothetical protein
VHGIIGIRGFPAAALLFSLFMSVAGASPSWCDELSGWYRSDPRAAAFAGVHDELGRIFSQARRQHIPETLLAARLREGAAKRVPADRMVSALRADLELLVRARLLVARAGGGGTFLSARGVSDGTLKEVGIYLRAGLPDHLIGELLSAGSGIRGGTESALAACEAILDLRAVAPIEDADSLQIGKLLMASGMQPSGYSSLALVYGLGMSRGLSQDHLVHDVIINTLSTGGGLAIMNQEIQSTPIAQPFPPALPASRARSPRSSFGHFHQQR